MLNAIRTLRGWGLLGLAAAALAAAGQQCSPGYAPPFFTPVQDEVPAGLVRVELINVTPDPVAPGLLVNGNPYVVDPPLAPDEAATIEFECVGGTTLQTDAIQLAPLGPIPSDNRPLVQDSAEFGCGDVVSFIFVDNGVDVFFTRVEVNGQFLMD